MLSVGILSIAVVLFAIQFKNIKPEYGVYITLAGCIVIVSCIVLKLEDIITLMDRLSDLTAVSKGYIKILLKITGITFIAEIASDIAKDCGYIAISNQVKIFGKISILAISLPVFSELIKTVGELLSQ
jgi:stage III sporulation protein AD